MMEATAKQTVLHNTIYKRNRRLQQPTWPQKVLVSSGFCPLADRHYGKNRFFALYQRQYEHRTVKKYWRFVYWLVSENG
ncbi:MAG: hypothetical protein GX625_14165 [Clostridiaceae bacterium]|nr:hypothetical protein [Clostridiaceae bacterium]